MKNGIKICGLLLSALLLMTGCGVGEQAAEETEPPKALYPVTIDGHEIIVGQTTVQVLADTDMRLTTSDKDADGNYMEFELDPDMELEAKSYYGSSTIEIATNMIAHFSVVTDEEPVPMREAVIAYLDFSLALGEESDRERIAFNGVPVNQLSREKVTELFPEFTGDDNMRFEYGDDHEYSLTFNMDGTDLGREKATELLPKFEGDDVIRHDYTNEHSCQINFNAAGTGLDAFSVQKSYNVDWDPEN